MAQPGTAPVRTGRHHLESDGTHATADRSKSLVERPIGSLLIAAFFALPAGSIEQSAVYDALGLSMFGASLLGIRRYRSTGWLPWLILAAGQLAFVIGDIIWTTDAAMGENPFPSGADISYLLGYPLLAVGLGLAIRRRVRPATPAPPDPYPEPEPLWAAWLASRGRRYRAITSAVRARRLWFVFADIRAHVPAFAL